MRVGPLSIHSLNSDSKRENDSRLGSRQSQKPFVYNPPVPIPQSQIIDSSPEREDHYTYYRQSTNPEPTTIEEENK